MSLGDLATAAFLEHARFETVDLQRCLDLDGRCRTNAAGHGHSVEECEARPLRGGFGHARFVCRGTGMERPPGKPASRSDENRRKHNAQQDNGT